ncbi:MAG: S-layer protein [Candidatus Woesearchaeota archaeon]
MLVVEDQKQALVSLPAKPLSERHLRVIASLLAQRILRELASKPTYPRDLAKRINKHEQLIYYHIRKLEKAGLIEVAKKQEVHGTAASIYAPTAPAYVFALKEFTEAHKVPGLKTRPDEFLSPIIENGEFNGVIIVGSPDPHGPEMARSRDGYYGIDLALFFGTFLTHLDELSVRLDTEVRSEDLQKNLILIGGPVVNTITQKVNDNLPLKFDSSKNWSINSSISGKVYHADECGIIVKAKNPFNPKKWILVVAGKRYAGTRAVTLAFIKYFNELAKGNSIDPKIPARVVEGLDKNADGIVDDVRFVE